MSTPRFSLVGGGSGGDTYPVVATGWALERLVPGTELQYFASPEGIERRLLTDHGYQPVVLEAERLQRDSLFRLPGALVRGFRVALAALREFRPGAVVSGGGFLSPAVVLAARWLGIPVAMLEPNSVGGRANRLLARLASLVVTGHELAASSFPDPGRVECLGMPMAFRHDPERARLRRAARSGRLVVGVMGGSLGARILNRAVWEQYPALGALEGLELIHVTGRRDHAAAAEAYQAAGAPASIEVRPFQQEMDALYEEVDLLVGRAGAMTCWELIEFRVPALLVPRALSHGDHQTKNARPLEAAGAAEVHPESRFDGALLVERIRDLLAHPEVVGERREAYARLQREDTEAVVARRILALAGIDAGPAALEEETP